MLKKVKGGRVPPFVFLKYIELSIFIKIVLNAQQHETIQNNFTAFILIYH